MTDTCRILYPGTPFQGIANTYSHIFRSFLLPFPICSEECTLPARHAWCHVLSHIIPHYIYLICVEPCAVHCVVLWCCALGCTWCRTLSHTLHRTLCVTSNQHQAAADECALLDHTKACAMPYPCPPVCVPCVQHCNMRAAPMPVVRLALCHLPCAVLCGTLCYVVCRTPCRTSVMIPTSYPAHYCYPGEDFMACRHEYYVVPCGNVAYHPHASPYTLEIRNGPFCKENV